MGLLEKVIRGQKILDTDITYRLYEICDDVHSSCDCSCPIYDMIFSEKERDSFSGCPYFKNGTKMLKALRKHFNKDVKK